MLNLATSIYQDLLMVINEEDDLEMIQDKAISSSPPSEALFLKTPKEERPKQEIYGKLMD